MTEHAAQPVIAVQLAGDEVRFLVNDVPQQTLPAPTYEALQKELAAKDISLFQLDLPDGRTFKLYLPPLKEIRQRAAVLPAIDENVFGRQYKVTQSVREGGADFFLIADAADDREVEKMPREEFAAHARAGHLRGATPYRLMLGEYNGRLYFTILNEIYTPPEKTLVEARESADATAEAADQQAAEAAEAPAEVAVAPWRVWLAHHGALAYVAALVGIIILVISLHFSLRGPSAKKAELDWARPDIVDFYLAEHEAATQQLLARGLASYAAEHPKAAEDAMSRLRDFLKIADLHPEMSGRQKERVEGLKEALKKLEAAE